MNPIAHAEAGPYLLEVFYDEDAESPRVWDCNLGTFLGWHRRYHSPDHNTYRDPEEFWVWWHGYGFDGECANCGASAGNLRPFHKWGTFSYECAVCEDVRDANGIGGTLLPVYMYEHSGVAYRTEPFGDPWDSGQIGYIYATADEIASMGTPANLVAECLREEVDTYSKWANGNVWGFTLSRRTACDQEESHDEEMDACWGFYGETEQEVLETIHDTCSTPPEGVWAVFAETFSWGCR